ncbi:MAG: c-type cytochrome [Proteobacteria bacterium]|nr:c-type cytochrome [Pseudomonadota bacterium]
MAGPESVGPDWGGVMRRRIRLGRGAVGLALAAVVAALPFFAFAAMTPEQRAAILAPTTDFSRVEAHEDLPGGSATNRKRLDREAYSQPSSTLSFADRADFFVGNGLFRRIWITSPSSTKGADGLGPLYNARGCQLCHLKDGRGHTPTGAGDSAVSMFLRLSVPPRTEEQRRALADHRLSVIPEPVYGGQLQDIAVPGLKAEGRMVIDYSDEPVELAGGETVVLRAPKYSVADLAYGPMQADAMLSPRVTPPMIGLGLLEAILEEDILAVADPEDADGDGISGRPNYGWSDAEGRVALGRFGWKAGKPMIADQAAAAMAGDIGLSNPLAPAPGGDCMPAQADCLAAPYGAEEGGLEAPAEVMDAIVFYSRHLAVPARRQADAPQVLAGKALFYGAGCIGCHTPKHATASGLGEGRGALSGQLIWPYTDLLLHDMGEGLAYGRPESEATGREWRTAPLWGIGLTETVNGHTEFLHDGRARDLTEAILWHGGEALASREIFRNMPPEDRAALIAFLNSL